MIDVIHQISWIEVRLSSEPRGGTKFTLDHIAHVDDERWAEFGPGAVGVGWNMGLSGLALHLTSGRAVDPAKAPRGWPRMKANSS